MCSSCSLQSRFGVRLRCRGFRKGFHRLIANSMGVIPTGTHGLPGRQARLRLVRSAGLRENSIYVFCQHHENPIPRSTSTRSQASRSAAFSQPKLARHADKVFIPKLCVWEFRCSLRSFTPRRQTLYRTPRKLSRHSSFPQCGQQLTGNENGG